MANEWQDIYRPKTGDKTAAKTCEACATQPEDGCDKTSCSTCAMADKCPSQQSQKVDESRERLQEAVAQIDHQILVLSGKGGVGKSTLSSSLAWALALRGQRVGLLDADLHGPTIPLMMGLRGERAQTNGKMILPVPIMDGLQVMSMGFLLSDENTPLIWRGAIRAGAIRQLIGDVEWGHLDTLIVDLPPGTGDEALTIAQSFPEADGAVIVTTPQEASLEDCRKAINFVRAMKLPVLGVIENMSGFICPCCGTETPIFKSGGGEAMAVEMGVRFLGRLPLSPEIVALSDQGQPLDGEATPEAFRKALDRIVIQLLEQSAE